MPTHVPPPPVRHQPRHNVQLLQAFPLRADDALDGEVARRRAAFYLDEKAKLLAGARVRAGTGGKKASWYDDPIALGTLLLLVPPIGLAALWSSKRYSNDARWALTVMTGLTLCLAAAITVAIIAIRSA